MTTWAVIYNNEHIRLYWYKTFFFFIIIFDMVWWIHLPYILKPVESRGVNDSPDTLFDSYHSFLLCFVMNG